MIAPLSDGRTVGIVIPAYNAARYLADALDSLHSQTLVSWKAIVVDDGSKDGSADVAQHYTENDPRILLHRQANAGRSCARNNGEAELPASVQYVMFLDADDVLQPTCLEVLAAYLDNNPEVGCVGCQFRPIDADGQLIPTAGLRREKAYRTRWVPGWLGIPRELGPEECPTPFVTFLTGSGIGPHALYRREIFQKVGRYDTNFDGREDQDLFRKVALEAPIHYLPNPLYLYRQHPTQSVNNHEKFADEGRRLSAKWNDMQLPDSEQSSKLRAANLYLKSVHEPMRHLRTGLRAFAERKYTTAAILAVKGITRLATLWPWYLARHHLRYQRQLRREMGTTF